MGRTLYMGIVAVALAAEVASAASAIAGRSGNGVQLSVLGGAGFIADFRSSIAPFFAPPINSDPSISLMTMNGTSLAPHAPDDFIFGIDTDFVGSGDGVVAVDEAKVSFTYGLPGSGVTDDTISFDVSATASALSAALDGFPADARIGVEAAALFFVDFFAGTDAPGDVGNVVGQVTVGAIRAALPYETRLEVTVTEQQFHPGFGAPSVTVLGAGSSATSFDTRIGYMYEIKLDYEILVPHGIDPDFDLSLDATVVPVPEPASLALLGLLAVGLSNRGGLVSPRRRR